MPPVPVYHWSWSRHGRCSELESRYKIRSRGRAGRAQLLPVFVLNPAPATPLCPTVLPLYMVHWSCLRQVKCCSPKYPLRRAVWLIKILKTAHPISEGLGGQASKLQEPSFSEYCKYPAAACGPLLLSPLCVTKPRCILASRHDRRHQTAPDHLSPRRRVPHVTRDGATRCHAATRHVSRSVTGSAPGHDNCVYITSPPQ